jgi:hypothetical protein
LIKPLFRHLKETPHRTAVIFDGTGVVPLKREFPFKTAIKFSMSIFLDLATEKLIVTFVNATFFIIKNCLIQLIYCPLSIGMNMNKMIYSGLIFCIYENCIFVA